MGHNVGVPGGPLPSYGPLAEAQALAQARAQANAHNGPMEPVHTPSLANARAAGNSQHFRRHAWAYIGRAPFDMTVEEFRSLFALEGEALALMADTEQIPAPSKADIDSLFATEEGPRDADADA